MAGIRHDLSDLSYGCANLCQYTVYNSQCMSPTWANHKSRLVTLLNVKPGDEEEEGLALDRFSHGQNVIGRSGEYGLDISPDN